MKILLDIRFYFVVSIISLLSLGIHHIKLENELIKCKTENGFIPGGDIERSELLNQIDSLRSEMFVKDIQIGSYEVMWGILEEVNKPLADSINLQVE